MKTKVLFLYHEAETGNSFPDIFAYFPYEKYNNNPMYKTCYTHIGQHSACNIDYANECRNATKKEYNNLMNELLSIGYNLEVLNN